MRWQDFYTSKYTNYLVKFGHELLSFPTAVQYQIQDSSSRETTPNWEHPNFSNLPRSRLSLRMQRSGMKQSQSLAIAIASLHYITLAMTKYIFQHLGCSLPIPFSKTN